MIWATIINYFGLPKCHSGLSFGSVGESKFMSTKSGRMNVKNISIAIICLSLSRMATASFVNYDNDPDLSQAFNHDPEMLHGDLSTASRAEAANYYFRYLEKDIPSFQQAKVYCQLGVMYTTTASAARGEDIDYDKAKKYFEKVLELEPERIGKATIRARSFLVSLPNQSLDDKISKGLDVYEWASAITQETLQENWLPNEPGQTEISRLDMSSLNNYIPSIMSSVALNTLFRISATEDSDLRFQRVSERFEGMPIAAFADAMAEGMSIDEGRDIYKSLAPATLEALSESSLTMNSPPEPSLATNSSPESAVAATNNLTGEVPSKSTDLEENKEKGLKHTGSSNKLTFTLCVAFGLLLVAGFGIRYLRKKCK